MEQHCDAEVAEIECRFAAARNAIAAEHGDLSDQEWIDAYERQKIAEREAASNFITNATEAFIAQSRSAAKASDSGTVSSS